MVDAATQRAALQTALAHHHAGRFGQAEQLYRQILAQNPDQPDALHLLGVIAGQAGRADAGIPLILRSIALFPTPEAQLNLGRLYVQLGQLENAAAAFRAGLALRADDPEILNALGAVLRPLGQENEALKLLQRAVELQPAFPDARVNLADLLRQRGELAAARQHYEKVLAADPFQAPANAGLGRLHNSQSQHAEAAACLQRALTATPNDTDLLNDLALALIALKRPAEARSHLEKAQTLQPDHPQVNTNLGLLLSQLGRHAEAIALYERALAKTPNVPETLNNLGLALRATNRNADAAKAFRAALTAREDFADAALNLAATLHSMGEFDDAFTTVEAAIKKHPNDAALHNNLASLIAHTGRVDEAIPVYARAASLRPADPGLHSNILFAMHFSPKENARSILAEARRWNQLHAAPLSARITPHANPRDPQRRLRVGYVSPDFREHCQSFFTVPLFRSHDPAQVEIYCYSSVAAPDFVTTAIRRHAHIWRDISQLNDEEAADLIRTDAIDILIDLTMHMARNRALIFARKPAPVQICWLAYPGTTGIATIDYRITDPWLDPPGCDETVYSEKTLRLPDAFWCYDPLSHEPAVNELPALTAGHVTFGSLNNFCKMHDAVLELWARVMSAVPNSRLIVLTGRGRHEQRLRDFFAARGIASARIDTLPHQPRPKYLATYHRIDLGLDPFPANGHTTSLDATWMGVPVITLAGENILMRGGLSQCENLKHPEWIARSSEEYIQIAAALAGDLPALAARRRDLRAELQASPLMDGPRFARAMEKLYRHAWGAWCNESP